MDRDTGGNPGGWSGAGGNHHWRQAPRPALLRIRRGDFVYLEDKEYKVTSLERGQVELLDPTLAYPVYRTETRANFERLLRQDQRNGAITEFLPADLERFDQDLREVLASGLLTDRDKDYISQWLRNGEGNTKLSQRLSSQFAGRVETMDLVTGETADYRATTTGLEVEIIRGR